MTLKKLYSCPLTWRSHSHLFSVSFPTIELKFWERAEAPGFEEILE